MSDGLTCQMRRSGCLAVIAMVVLEMTQGVSQAQMTAKEFDALPDADKRTVLVSALQERERAVRNLQALSVTHMYTLEYRDGKTGSPIRENEACRYVCELRRKDGNHWASIDWFLPDSKPDEPDEPLAKMVTTMDSKSGVSRSQGQHRQMKGVYGCIDTDEDALIRAGRFHYWFEALFDKPRRFLIRFLLNHQEAIKFEGRSSDGQAIRISLRVVDTSVSPPFEDSRTIWIDPQRGFMPVRMHLRWVPKSTPVWSDGEMEIKKMERVDGIWFPTHFTETFISGSSVAGGYACVYETTVGPIKLGAVTDNDLQVHFDNGVKVNDRIQGVWFVADEATQSTPLVQTAPATHWQWFIGMNVVLLLTFTTISVLRAHRRKRIVANLVPPT